jgi:uncharacterized protein (DUF924 family)
MEELARRILLFWFGAPPHSPRDAWFRKDPAFDAAVGREFAPAVLHALEGGWQAWDAEPQGALVRILLLDQFTRNMHRDSPRAFAGDALALAAAQTLVARGDDARLGPLERWFAYLPFEHAESWPAQERSLALFAQLAAETGIAAPLEWAQKHADVIRRFGRYPHRNELLGRTSTPEEIAFLAQPGSRF